MPRAHRSGSFSGRGDAIAAYRRDQDDLGAEAAAARHGWPLHVVDDAAADPAHEQLEQFLGILRGVLTPSVPRDDGSGRRSASPRVL